MEKKKYDNMTPELAAQVRAYRRQIRLSIGAMVLAIGITAVSTLAWFVNSRSVDSDGMKTQIQVSSNLVISDSDANIKNLMNGTPNSQTDPFRYTFTLATQYMAPASHGFKTPDTTKDCASGLYYNSNPDAVGFSTGLGDTLTFEPVTDTTGYYYDFVVYVASANKAFTATSFVATMAATPINREYIKASSIDFYVGEVNEANYCGTLNAAGYNYELNNQAEYKSVELISKIDRKLIPLNTENSIQITMRCYFDGALKKNNETTFVRSDGLVIDEACSMSVNFTATEQADAGSNS